MLYIVRKNCVYRKVNNKRVGCTDGSMEKYLTKLGINESNDFEWTDDIPGEVEFGLWEKITTIIDDLVSGPSSFKSARTIKLAAILLNYDIDVDDMGEFFSFPPKDFNGNEITQYQFIEISDELTDNGFGDDYDGDITESSEFDWVNDGVDDGDIVVGSVFKWSSSDTDSKMELVEVDYRVHWVNSITGHEYSMSIGAFKLGISTGEILYVGKINKSNENLTEDFFFKGVNPTVDLVVTRGDEVLLIKRSDDSDIEAGKWALPGGFHDTKAKKGEEWKDDKETSLEAAKREVKEETGLDVSSIGGLSFEMVGVFEGGGRDPRDKEDSWTRSTVYKVQIPEDMGNDVKGMDDAQEAKWVPIKTALKTELAFDHHIIIEKSLSVNESDNFDWVSDVQPEYHWDKEKYYVLDVRKLGNNNILDVIDDIVGFADRLDYNTDIDASPTQVGYFYFNPSDDEPEGYEIDWGTKDVKDPTFGGVYQMISLDEFYHMAYGIEPLTESNYFDWVESIEVFQNPAVYRINDMVKREEFFRTLHDEGYYWDPNKPIIQPDGSFTELYDGLDEYVVLGFNDNDRKIVYHDRKIPYKTSLNDVIVIESRFKPKSVSESIKLPVDIGDTIYMGKFKNKKTIVKDIEWNEKGDLLINGKSALRLRITKNLKKLKKVK